MKFNPARYYDRVAAVYDLFTGWFYAPMRRELVKNLEIRQDDKVLVVACGTGSLFKYIKEKGGENVWITGVDISEKMLARARRKIRRHNWKNIALIQADASKMDKNLFRLHGVPEEYDVVIGELAFSVIPQWKEALSRAVDVLKSGGRLGLLDWYCPRKNLIAKIVDFLACSDCTRPVVTEARKLLGNLQIVRRYFGGYVYVAISFR